MTGPATTPVIDVERLAQWLDGTGLPGKGEPIEHRYISGGTQNAATFSEITFNFRFGPKVLMQGMILAVVMGLIGGLFPAIRATRLEITDALRQR